ncbi:adenosylcobinamide-phosphate synthase CbiB [Verrucomicrobiota bacterium]
MPDAAIILTAAFLLDFTIGDPVYPYHPVRLIGLLVGQLEKQLYDRIPHIWGGVALGLLTVTGTLAAYGILIALLPDWAVNIFLLYSSIALHDLLRHAKAVQQPLANGNVDAARKNVQMIVGRDANLLDAHGTARAAIESVAESFVDGFLSPIFWFTIGTLLFNVNGGVALVLAFKAISTLDSMVGYRNERYRRFGTFSALADDLFNFVPARLSIPLISVCAYALNQNFRDAWRIGWRDRLKHASPNSAHAEATVAGALNIRLGGPTVYAHGTSDKPWLGDGTPAAGADHIEATCSLIRYSSVLTFTAALLAFLF